MNDGHYHGEWMKDNVRMLFQDIVQFEIESS